MIAMLHVEYRESRGVDFLVSSRDAYRELRGIVTREGIAGLFVGPVVLLREARMDQYGIRTLIAVDDVPIEFEIVLEARIDLDTGQDGITVCGVRALTHLDQPGRLVRCMTHLQMNQPPALVLDRIRKLRPAPAARSRPAANPAR